VYGSSGAASAVAATEPAASAAHASAAEMTEAFRKLIMELANSRRDVLRSL
jgi:hypothetical protein